MKGGNTRIATVKMMNDITTKTIKKKDLGSFKPFEFDYINYKQH